MGAYFQELIHAGIYKRSQGRITRQVTAIALVVSIAIGSFQLSQYLIGQSTPLVRFSVPGLLMVMGAWAVYRLVNVPAFADFLIAVEAEMNKVSWPSRSELIRASLIVLVMIFALAALLGFFDLFWRLLFQKTGIFS